MGNLNEILVNPGNDPGKPDIVPEIQVTIREIQVTSRELQITIRETR
jgi:hypothetical protein